MCPRDLGAMNYGDMRTLWVSLSTQTRGGYRIFKRGGCGLEKWVKKTIRA